MKRWWLSNQTFEHLEIPQKTEAWVLIFANVPKSEDFWGRPSVLMPTIKINDLDSDWQSQRPPCVSIRRNLWKMHLLVNNLSFVKIFFHVNLFSAKQHIKAKSIHVSFDSVSMQWKVVHLKKAYKSKNKPSGKQWLWEDFTMTDVEKGTAKQTAWRWTLDQHLGQQQPDKANHRQRGPGQERLSRKRSSKL